MTEGLLSYLDDETVEGCGRASRRCLGGSPKGSTCPTSVFARPERGIAEHAFDVILGAFVRGRVHPYRGDEAAAKAALRSAGFEQAQLHRSDEHPAATRFRGDPGAGVVCIIEATANDGVGGEP